MRSFLAAAFVLALTGAASAAPALVPRPNAIGPAKCAHPLSLAAPLAFAPDTQPGGLELLRERWRALGIPAPRLARSGERAAVAFRRRSGDAASEAYGIVVGATGATVSAAGSAGAFDALMTLAQLPERDARGWHIGCTAIEDAPALRWRIVSDDVSRGPFPTMAYAKERIRALASLKLNGWSPYMEQVFADPRHPYVAWPNGWTAAQLRELADYARRFHVTLIPEQQTFAHMHETLKWEALAPLAELPHGYLMAESDPRTYQYLEPLLRDVVAATKPTPFVHVGSDEPIDLGRGRTPRTPQVFADHVNRVAGFLAGSGARPMIWDDAIQQDKTILGLIPKDTVVVTFHYGNEKTYRPYIDTIANAGFDQMVAPGAANWNELYPDLGTSYANVAKFVGEAKGARGMLGMFFTVWHDDGETLFEATWPTVAYAAATAWQREPVADATWHADFARAFFGSDDPRYARGLDALQAIRPLLKTAPASDQPDYVFWRDPFDPRLQARVQPLDLAGVRTRAEAALTDLWNARPPLHPHAAEAMRAGRAALRCAGAAAADRQGGPRLLRRRPRPRDEAAAEPGLPQPGRREVPLLGAAQRRRRHRAGVRCGLASREHRTRTGAHARALPGGRGPGAALRRPDRRRRCARTTCAATRSRLGTR